MLTATPKKKIKIPSYLIREEINGIVLPYKGYLEVIKGKKTKEEIIGSSSLQSILVYIIGLYIGNHLNRKKYRIATNEPGLHIDANNNLSNDIAIYEKDKLKPDNKYFSITPKVAIEVDIKIDLNQTEWTNEWDYVIAKSNTILNFGTEKVIWISTVSKKIFVSSKTEKWYLVDSNENIPLIDDCILNLEALLLEEELHW